MRETLSSTQGMQFSCPSQLFVEFILITSDGKFPITSKSDSTSVYARRNQSKLLKTCGFEIGPNWNKVVRPSESGKVEINLQAAAEDGLKNEYEMPDWAHRMQEVRLEVSLFVLQTLHMNTAVLGLCRVPFSSEELYRSLRGKRCGGMDHADLEFVGIERSAEFVANYANSVEWHGTAVSRLNLLARSVKRIQSELPLSPSHG